MKLIFLALFSATLLSSCRNLYDVGLKSLPVVANANRVAICQSEKLNRATVMTNPFLLQHVTDLTLPKNLLAQKAVSALPSSINGQVIEGLERPRHAANHAIPPFRERNYASAYDSIAPMKGYDLVIHISPARICVTGGGGGYFNFAAGVYIPMGTGTTLPGEGGIGANKTILNTFNVSSLLDVFVYQGIDGKCLGSFYTPIINIEKNEGEIQSVFNRHLSYVAKQVMTRIFAH